MNSVCLNLVGERVVSVIVTLKIDDRLRRLPFVYSTTASLLQSFSF
jgi:hypothetical protein